MTKHIYNSHVKWTGNRGSGTSQYKAYDRTWRICVDGKPEINCSNDPLLGGDPSKYNPEDLLLTALSSCHMLWYLHLCSNAAIVVQSYEDRPEGIGEVAIGGKGKFISAILKPKITISSGDPKTAISIHDQIHDYCFIAQSVNFPVNIEAEVKLV